MKDLPRSVRYIKNGRSGRWWAAAKSDGQLHGGWRDVPDDLLIRADLDAIRALSPEVRGDTKDLNALLMLVDRPSQHLWVTIEQGALWWCTVRDTVSVTDDRADERRGHFWLHCDQPWRSTSLGGRHLAAEELPGTVTLTAGFKGTACEPSGAEQILRIIHDEVDPAVLDLIAARKAFETSVASLLQGLHHKDFEVLVDLVLARDGWARLSKLGGVTEGVDLEVQNASAEEIAFVQVKSQANQAVLDDYIERFQARRARYARMIFAVHTPRGQLKLPVGEPVQIWDQVRIARLVVQHGLAGWLASKF